MNGQAVGWAERIRRQCGLPEWERVKIVATMDYNKNATCNHSNQRIEYEHVEKNIIQ